MSGILLASVGNSYGSLPVNIVAPAVTGTATEGQTLSTTDGTWTGAPAPTFSYQWQRNSVDISGATSSTYLLVAADVGNPIRCVVTATNPLGAVSANSNATANVAALNNFIATPTATPAIGGALEGGFHTGLIWNQVTQSATSTTIGTGSKTFTVTDAAPLFYSGQAVEVRSRANPATARMIGTVTASIGTTLTVNVTSVDGSGTLTDWSVMAKFRVIVAPKSSGENSGKQYKNANTAAPAACGTLTEGLKATVALVADGNSTVYPAAHFCNDLTIGGYSDWYLPARDELELIYRNLKPVTDNNYTVTDRPTGATPDYKNLGSLGDVANTHGLNNNSDPQGVAYTTTVPGQTSVAAFQSGGAEAMTFGSNVYWPSTEYSTTLAWSQVYFPSTAGRQANGNKTNSRYVRAVRRSII